MKIFFFILIVSFIISRFLIFQIIFLILKLILNAFSALELLNDPHKALKITFQFCISTIWKYFLCFFRSAFVWRLRKLTQKKYICNIYRNSIWIFLSNFVSFSSAFFEWMLLLVLEFHIFRFQLCFLAQKYWIFTFFLDVCLTWLELLLRLIFRLNDPSQRSRSRWKIARQNEIRTEFKNKNVVKLS